MYVPARIMQYEYHTFSQLCNPTAGSKIPGFQHCTSVLVVVLGRKQRETQQSLLLELWNMYTLRRIYRTSSVYRDDPMHITSCMYIYIYVHTYICVYTYVHVIDSCGEKMVS